MTKRQAEWAAEHDWFRSMEERDGYWLVWVNENGKMHPWPFKDYSELRRWAGY